MGKYAFCFEHKIFAGEDNNKIIKEYFIPYRPEILFKVVKNGILKQRLARARRLGRTFDDFIEEHNLRNEEYIVRLPEDGNIDNSWWINELLHLMVKSSVAQNKTNRDTIQLNFLQKACKVA